MGSVVTLKVRPRPPRGVQDGLLRTSYQMYLMLCEISALEDRGGAACCALSFNTLGALRARGLVAEYQSYGARVCLSPIGWNVKASWDRRLKDD